MATASILQARDILQPFQHEVMEASIIYESPRTRHGRCKSISKSISKTGRARGLSNATPPVNERETSLIKGLNWIRRHGQDQEILELDEACFVDCKKLLNWQYMQTLGVEFSELQSLLENNATARHRFTLKLKDSATPESKEASDWLLASNQINNNKKKDVVDAEIKANLEPITLEAGNVPEVVIFQTTYAAYPLILSKGSLENATGQYIHFSTEVSGEAEVLIYIDVQKALLQESEMHWFRGEGTTRKASVVTDGGKRKAVDKAFWKRVVGRKNEVGLLWEDGEVVKDVPTGLRGWRRASAGRGGNGREKGKAGKERGERRGSLNAESEEEEKAVEAVKEAQSEEED